MANLDRSFLIARLENFYEQLRQYRICLFEDRDLEEAEEVRQEVVREAGALRPIVETLVGHRTIAQFGQQIGIWEEGLRRYQRDSPYARTCLDALIDMVNEAIGRLQSDFSTEIVKLHKLAHSRPKVFIAHGGETTTRKALELFLWKKADCEPVVVEDIPDTGTGPDTKINLALGEVDFAIVLVETSGASTQDGKLLPRANVIDEIERIRLKLNDKFLILLEQGVDLPSNISGAVTWESFSSSNVDAMLLKVIHHLRQKEIT